MVRNLLIGLASAAALSLGTAFIGTNVLNAQDQPIKRTILHRSDLPGAAGTLFSLLPPENASGNFVKVIQRLPVRIRFNTGQDTQHVLRPGMSVEPTVKVR